MPLYDADGSKQKPIVRDGFPSSPMTVKKLFVHPQKKYQ